MKNGILDSFIERQMFHQHKKLDGSTAQRRFRLVADNGISADKSAVPYFPK